MWSSTAGTESGSRPLGLWRSPGSRNQTQYPDQMSKTSHRKHTKKKQGKQSTVKLGTRCPSVGQQRRFHTVELAQTSDCQSTDTWWLPSTWGESRSAWTSTAPNGGWWNMTWQLVSVCLSVQMDQLDISAPGTGPTYHTSISVRVHTYVVWYVCNATASDISHNIMDFRKSWMTQICLITLHLKLFCHGALFTYSLYVLCSASLTPPAGKDGH